MRNIDDCGINMEAYMEIFRKKIGPVFLKESSNTDEYIEKMESLYKRADDAALKREIEKQIKLAKYGQLGENNVSFELKNSGIDMYILHDCCFKVGELSAQIDYIVITRKHTYVIECKNLIGDIEINNNGDFIRTYELFGKKVREGIYSPITQNQRHLNMLKDIRRTAKTNFVSKMIFEKYFDEQYKSIIVLANPKACLNAKYAKKEIKEQVIRADQLITYIKEMDAKAKDINSSIDEMNKLAMFYLDMNHLECSDYSQKYDAMLQKVNNLQESESVDESNYQIIKKEEIIEKLKNFRLEESRKEKIKPYYIFNNEQMNNLIEKAPRTKDELIKISGFGSIKTEKYGDAILKCLWE